MLKLRRNKKSNNVYTNACRHYFVFLEHLLYLIQIAKQWYLFTFLKSAHCVWCSCCAFVYPCSRLGVGQICRWTNLFHFPFLYRWDSISSLFPTDPMSLILILLKVYDHYYLNPVSFPCQEFSQAAINFTGVIGKLKVTRNTYFSRNSSHHS